MSNEDGFDAFSRGEALNDPETVAVREEINDELGPVVRREAETEGARLKVIVDEINDLIGKCNIPADLLVRDALDVLRDDYEVRILTTRRGPASVFHERPERVKRFTQEISELIDEQIIGFDMPLTEVLDVLGKQSGENEKVINYTKELEHERSEREKFRQLIDMCTLIDGASGDMGKAVQVERVRSYSDEDRLVLRIEMKETMKAMHFAEELGKAPRSSVERDGRSIIFSAPFKKSFLDAAHETFPWIPEIR